MNMPNNANLRKAQISGSQTFPMRGPLRIIWWSAKHKLLICIGIHGPLRLIMRTTNDPRSRLWESLAQMDKKNDKVHLRGIKPKLISKIQSNMCTTATIETQKYMSLLTGGRCSKVIYVIHNGISI